VLPYCSDSPILVPAQQTIFPASRRHMRLDGAGQRDASYAVPLAGWLQIRHGAAVPIFYIELLGGTGPDDVIPKTAGYIRLDARVGLESPDHRGLLI